MTILKDFTKLLLGSALAVPMVGTAGAESFELAEHYATRESAGSTGSSFCEIGLGAVAFASEPLTRAFLGRRDEWAKSLSDYDLGARQGTAEPTNLRQFLRFARSHASAWSVDEELQWQPLVDALNDALVGLNVKLPIAFMSKTTGEEELDASAYTRQRTTFFNDDLSALPIDNPRAAFRLLAHELFHIASRYDPRMRDALYELIGFHRIDGFEYPAALEDRRVTNPDAFRYTHAITVQSPDGPVDVVVVVQQTVPLEEVIGQNFFATVTLVLVAVDPDTGQHLVDQNGEPVLYHLGNTDYVPLMLRNSNFIIAAEEVLADNFATLMEWRKDGELPPDSGGIPINDLGLLQDIEATLADGCD